MFPLSDYAIFALTASAPFLAGALSGVLRRRWSSLALVAAAVVFCAVYLRPALALGDAQARGIALPLFGVLFLFAWLFGELWGWGLRMGQIRIKLDIRGALAICLLPALGLSAWVLQRQFVPVTCLGGITVEMRGERYEIGIDDTARLVWFRDGAGEDVQFFSARQDRKDSLARLCRLSGNGESAVTPDEVSLGRTATRANSCREGVPCITTDTSEFRLERVAINDPVPPSAWFGDEIRDDIRWSGTPEDGWICFLPNGSFTWVNCQRWITPVPGLRAVASADLESGSDSKRAVEELERVIADWLARLSAKP